MAAAATGSQLVTCTLESEHKQEVGLPSNSLKPTSSGTHFLQLGYISQRFHNLYKQHHHLMTKYTNMKAYGGPFAYKPQHYVCELSER